MSKVWRAEVGTCQDCRREQRLDDGRHVAEHPYPSSRDVRCSGSGKLAIEARDANAEVSRRRALARLEKLRADAAVAHDALVARAMGATVAFPEHQILELRKAALQEYRMKFPKVRTQRLWFIAARGKRRGSAWAAPKCDVYCTLCRELLLQGVGRGYDHTERTREHTTLCAMKRLAGMAEYVAPGEKRMPEDALPRSVEF